MAKVTGPLLSLGASGQIAKTLVFMKWKGIDDVRKYVIPANPQTTDQMTQRTIFGDAVDDFHLTKYTAADKTAWDKYAAILAKAMTGFNAFVKSWIDLVIEFACAPNPPYAGQLLDAAGGKFDAYCEETGSASAVILLWGYSKTALNNAVALNEWAANQWRMQNIVATAGMTVYGRFRTQAITCLGYSGIFETTVT